MSIIVRDFNPYAVRAALAARGRSHGLECAHRKLPNGNLQTLKTEETVILAGTVFGDDVRSALPYIETVTQNRYRYEGFLIDKEGFWDWRYSSLLSLCWSTSTPVVTFGSQVNKDDEIEISSFDVHRMSNTSARSIWSWITPRCRLPIIL